MLQGSSNTSSHGWFSHYIVNRKKNNIFYLRCWYLEHSLDRGSCSWTGNHKDFPLDIGFSSTCSLQPSQTKQNSDTDPGCLNPPWRDPFWRGQPRRLRSNQMVRSTQKPSGTWSLAVAVSPSGDVLYIPDHLTVENEVLEDWILGLLGYPIFGQTRGWTTFCWFFKVPS